MATTKRFPLITNFQTLQTVMATLANYLQKKLYRYVEKNTKKEDILKKLKITMQFFLTMIGMFAANLEK